MSDNKDIKKKNLVNVAIVGATYDATQKYGAAIKTTFCSLFWNR